MTLRLSILLLILPFFYQCKSDQLPSSWTAESPGKKITVHVFLNADGQAAYSVLFGEKTVIDTSTLGFTFEGQEALAGGLTVKGAANRAFSETWETVWGEDRMVENKYNELALDLQEKEAPNRQFSVVFRIYDDGIGFRYEFPEQEGLSDVLITEENTEFKLTGDHMTWWQPGDWDIYEHLYNTTRFSEIDAIAKRNHPPGTDLYSQQCRQYAGHHENRRRDLPQFPRSGPI